MVVATRPRKIESPAVETIAIFPVLSLQMVQENTGRIVRLGDWMGCRHRVDGAHAVESRGAVHGAAIPRMWLGGSIGRSWPCTCVMHLEDLEPEMLQRLTKNNAKLCTASNATNEMDALLGSPRAIV